MILVLVLNAWPNADTLVCYGNLKGGDLPWRPSCHYDVHGRWVIVPLYFLLLSLPSKFGKYMRPVPTKWETSRKISFESYKQILNVQTLSFKMVYNMPLLLPYLGAKTHYFLEKFLCFLLIFEMFNEPYLFSSLATCRSFCENRSHMCTCIALRGPKKVK